MSEITLDDRGQALENEYFHRQERELIEKMKAKLAAENKESSEMDCPKNDGGKLVESDYESIKINAGMVCLYGFSPMGRHLFYGFLNGKLDDLCAGSRFYFCSYHRFLSKSNRNL